ncbi:hypothetical protein H4582DRAFT_2008010 [Lactarius indigo]|nr:hypothetical protein H4582DRAFT_2008010 [Lactarius indigo]
MFLELFREIVCFFRNVFGLILFFCMHYCLVPSRPRMHAAHCTIHLLIVPIVAVVSYLLPSSSPGSLSHFHPLQETSLNPIRIPKTFRISQFEPTPAATDWENQHFLELSKYRSHDLIPQGSANARNLR